MADFIKAGAQLEAGKSAQEQAEANAKIDIQDAAVVKSETKARTLEIFQQGRRASKTIRAMTAASGFAQEGTPLLLQAEAIKQAELTSLEEQRIGLTEEKRLLESAKLNKRRGKIARRTSQIQALGSVVGGLQDLAAAGA
jgi:hypothetical protein